MLVQTKTSLDVALSQKMVSLSVELDARCKRQASAVAATKAALEEVERGIAAADSLQRDLLESPRADNADTPVGKPKAR